GDLLQALVGLAAEHLLDRALDAGMARAEEAREAPVADQAEQLHLDVGLCEALADERVVEQRAPAGMLARRPHDVLEAATDLPLEGERPPGPALVGEDPHRA